MQWFENMSIRAKVMTIFSVILTVTVVLGAFAVNRLSTVNDATVRMATNYLVAANELGDLATQSARFRQREASYLLVSPAERAKEEKRMDDTVPLIEKNRKAYLVTVDTPEEHLVADKIEPAWNAFMEAHAKYIAMSKSGTTAEAAAYYVGDMRVVFNAYMDIVDKAAEFQVTAGDAETKSSADTYAFSRNMIFGVLALAGGLCLLSGWMIVYGVSNPIRAMTEAMSRLARHDLSTEINGVGRKDEVGQMASAVQVFKDSMIESDRLKAEQEAAQKLAAERSAVIDKLTREFDQSIQVVVQTVSSQATQMESSAQSMSATAEETTKQASAVAAASEESAANVQTVASATEELSSSITEISRQVGHSSQITSNAVNEASKASEMVQGLVSASQKIGEIVALINDIADQTNLLALNATIEAARAGEAGKGFAVVAAEVKNLAAQTSKATEEIGAQITSVQNATQDAVQAIDSISKTIGEVDSIATTIAAAVEEQGAATREIARNVEEAAKGTQEVSSNIGGVTEAANGTGAVANQVLTSARSLSEQSQDLRATVQAFLTNVKAA